MARRAPTIVWCWTCWDRVWRSSLTDAAASLQCVPSATLPCKWYQIELIIMMVVGSTAKHPRTRSHLPRHQTRQFPGRPARHHNPPNHHIHCRLWHGQTLHRHQNQPAHPLQRPQSPVRHRPLHVHKHAPRARAVEEGRLGVLGTRIVLLFARVAAVARIKVGE